MRKRRAAPWRHQAQTQSRSHAMLRLQGHKTGRPCGGEGGSDYWKEIQTDPPNGLWWAQSKTYRHSINLLRREISKTVTLQYYEVQVQWLFRRYNLEFKTTTLGEPSKLQSGCQKTRGRKCWIALTRDNMQVHYFFLPVTPATTCRSDRQLNAGSNIFSDRITACKQPRVVLRLHCSNQ